MKKYFYLSFKYVEKILFVFLFLCITFYSCTSSKLNLANNDLRKVYKQSYDSPVPNSNFVFLKKQIYDSENKSTVPFSSASGLAIKRNKNTVYALTAAHWCQDTDDDIMVISREFNYPIEEVQQHIEKKVDFYGETVDLQIVNYSVISDLCLVKFTSKNANKIKKLKTASEVPKIGDNVYTISAPLSVAHHKIRNHFSGKFSGCVNPYECMYTIPGIYGSSGSVILNEKSEIVGILNFAMIGFPNMTGGASLNVIKEFINEQEYK